MLFGALLVGSCFPIDWLLGYPGSVLVSRAVWMVTIALGAHLQRESVAPRLQTLGGLFVAVTTGAAVVGIVLLSGGESSIYVGMFLATTFAIAVGLGDQPSAVILVGAICTVGGLYSRVAAGRSPADIGAWVILSVVMSALAAWGAFASRRIWSAELEAERVNAKALEAVAIGERRYHEIFSAAKDALLVHDASTGRIVDANDMVEKLYGYTRDELGSLTPSTLSAGQPPYTDKEVGEWIRKAVKEGPQSFEWLARRKGGETFWVEVGLIASPVAGEMRVLASVRDISAKKASEAENRNLQDKLALAQKMESIGRLAGGVAHDINNMLTVILGEVEFLKGSANVDAEERGGLNNIHGAALRSRDITRQLLAFSRRQIIAPKVVDLNLLVESFRGSLTRLLGEDLEVVLAPAPALWSVRIDPAQVDQLLMNLVVNARDAMPSGGSIRVETQNVTLDAAASGGQDGRRPGQYVRLRVADHGVGMDGEMLAHLFEPFYTSKDVGKGTGLGLATVYGIVTQNGGFIDVTSAPGKGTTFEINLPRCTAEAPDAAVPLADLPAGSETILLVEDDEPVREMVTRFLKSLGYQVVVTRSAEEAISVCQQPSRAFDLMVTDVVMPRIQGPELVERVRAFHPNVRTLFMSGYTADVVVTHGVREGMHFLQKPFSKGDLAKKLRAALAGP